MMAATGFEKKFLYLSFFIAALLMEGGGYGFFFTGTYAGETKNWQVQAIGQDMTGLFLIVPVLITSGILAYYKNRTGFFIFGGTLLFIVYSYVIYCFGVHFNFLFLVYCLTLGFSVYAFAWFISFAAAKDIKAWFSETVPVKLPGIFLLIIAVGFGLLWLSEIIPAILEHRTPASVSEAGLPTNPVHVLDLSILLPGMAITAFFLFKKTSAGFLMVPVLLVFCALMAVNIAGLVALMNIKGLDNSIIVAEMMGVLALVCILLFIAMMRHLKP